MNKSLEPRRVVIVDDSPAFLEAAARLVSVLPGCVLAGAWPAPHEAEVLIAGGGADVALVDFGLAQGRGLEIARRLRAADPRLAVIMLSLFSQPDAPAIAARAGVEAVVSKTAFARELAAALGALVGERQAA